MSGPTGSTNSIVKKLIILAVAALAYAASYWPSHWFRGHVLDALGNPPFAGPWMLFEHAFVFSTLTATACLIAWLVLIAAGLMGPIPLGRGKGMVFWGVVGAAVSIAATFALLALTHPDALHWIPPKPWSIAGNLFSNFYEEFIYRGFLLAALTRVFGFWPAALVSSSLFGMSHSQYPLDIKILVGAIGFLFCLIARRAQTIWAPWISHMGLDVVVDLFF